ncbi:ABC transporter substrate-binding protein [Streptomyces collinus]
MSTLMPGTRCFRLSAAVFAASAVVATACSSSSRGADQRPLQPLHFQFGAATATAETANVVIAKYLGYYKDEGLDVTFSFGGTGNVTQNLELLKSGRAHIAYTVPSSLLVAAAQQHPFGAELICNEIPTGVYKIAVKKESLIRTVADLVGKRVGIGSAGDP